VVAVALVLGPTARPLAAWAGLPLAAASCDCPPARCHCPHTATRHQESSHAPSAAGSVATSSSAAAPNNVVTSHAGGHDHARRPSCPLRAAGRPGHHPDRGAAAETGAAEHAAKHGAKHAATHAATDAATHAARPAPPTGTAPCTIAASCGDEAPSGTGAASWHPAAAMPTGWAVPPCPGDRSPPAAAAKLLDTLGSPELPPPRRIAPIA
jgi:hypothetical protein